MKTITLKHIQDIFGANDDLTWFELLEYLEMAVRSQYDQDLDEEIYQLVKSGSLDEASLLIALKRVLWPGLKDLSPREIVLEAKRLQLKPDDYLEFFRRGQDQIADNTHLIINGYKDSGVRFTRSIRLISQLQKLEA